MEVLLVSKMMKWVCGWEGSREGRGKWVKIATRGNSSTWWNLFSL